MANPEDHKRKGAPDADAGDETQVQQKPDDDQPAVSEPVPEKAPKTTWKETKTVTSVYVEGLPDDITVDEVESIFKKCGLIKVDLDTGAPRIKIYRDKETGRPKGDGLVTFLKEPSVPLAIQLLDGVDIRDGCTLRVKKAEFTPSSTYKGSNRIAKKKRKKGRWDNYQQSQLSWKEGDDARLLPKVVVVSHAFNPYDLAKNPDGVDELKEDFLSEAQKIGPVQRIMIFDQNQDGVLSLTFEEHEHAKECIKLFNGRFFDKQQLIAHFWDGVTNYKKIDEKLEAERLAAFGDWLEGDDTE